MDNQAREFAIEDGTYRKKYPGYNKKATASDWNVSRDSFGGSRRHRNKRRRNTRNKRRLRR